MNETQQKIAPRLLQLFNGFFERFIDPIFNKLSHYIPEGLTARNVLLFSVFSLLFLGTIVIMSASMGVSDTRGFETYKFIKNQGLFICIALTLILGVRYYLKPKWLFNNNTILLMIFTIILLFVVLLVGTEVNGSKRWINLNITNFQPSELAKFSVAVFAADYVVRRADAVRTSILSIGRFLGLFSPIIALIMMEPDLGATVVVFLACAVVFFLSGIPVKHASAILFLCAGAGAMAAWLSPYRRARLLSFTDPFDDPLGSGLQLSQSLIAFGRGEWTGVGLGNSLQKLAYLPEAHTDFLLAIAAEEFGFIGICVIFALSFMLVVACMRIGHNALMNKYMRLGYLCYSIGTIFLLQILVNAGMNMGLMPTKGLTLPFMSYGGSSLVVCSIMVGVVWRTDTEIRNQTNNDLL